MSRIHRILCLLTLALFIAAPATVSSQDKPKADPPDPAKSSLTQDQEQQEEEDEFKIDFGGAYSAWGLVQHNFFLGKDVPLNDAEMIVQNFRLKMNVGTSKLGAVLRADAAQGWWGVNNSPNVETTAVTDADGNVTNQTQYNPFALFRNKDTNYAIHFDQAYVYFDIPYTPARAQVGRQYFAVGNKLVLDYDLDAIQVAVDIVEPVSATAFWGKVSEGFQSFKTPVGALQNDDDAFSDTNLYGVTVDYKSEPLNAQLFGLYYDDNTPDWDYYPQGFGFFYSRFQPQITQATALGVAADGKFDVAQGLHYKFEFDYLFGEDEVDNDTFLGNLVDKNNGDLSGYNLYANLTQKLDVGVPLDLGVTFGLGSGDEDPSSGEGNINRIMTMGFFPLTNVWEDSVMPDIGGISPQGLGSPASRGYRELQNTTAVQAKLGVKPLDALRLEASYTYLKATEPITGWDADGPTDVTSDDIGQEIDVNAKLAIYDNLKLIALGGYFMPGEGSSLLITGTPENQEDAWELKTVLLYTF